MKRHGGIRKKRFFVSIALAAAINVFRYYDPVDEFLDQLVQFYAAFLPHSPTWAVHVLFFILVSVAAYTILISRLGDLLYDRWKHIEQTVGLLLRVTFGQGKSIYSERERTVYEFRHDILTSIEHSHSMLCLLATGYTMVYGEEHFLLDMLKQLSPERLYGMDIRILLLDRHSAAWQIRAQQVVAHDDYLKTIGV
jgi:hypothetical protein